MMWGVAILTGLAGSLHCIGMCGPLAMALPGEGSQKNNFISRIFYNSGRIFSYGILGAIFGLLGQGFSLFGLQRGLTLSAGIILILILIFGLGAKRFRILNLWSQLITGLFNRIWKIRSGVGPFLFGMVNGFLPCGLVYVAIAGAVVTSNPVDGFIYMVLFGLGTFPAMYFISVLSPLTGFKVKRIFKKMSPVLVFVFACIFILRGLNLGIPYLSPKYIEHTDSVECCEVE